MMEDITRIEYIASLTNELGLDRLMAATLYRGRRLQEMGQLKKAKHHLETILNINPECSEVSENLRVVQSLLEELQGKETKSMPVILEKELQLPATTTEDISSLSHTSSRLEHIAYLTKELGLDRSTAATLYRGERLQEKGQLKQAMYYFETVLKKYPDCSEAYENLRIVKTLVEEEHGKETKSMPVIPEKESPESLPMIVTEMEVTWSGLQDPKRGCISDANKCAVYEAEKRLREIGFGDSLLKLLSNTITNRCCDGCLTYLKGNALFQVALIPETESDAGQQLHLPGFSRSFSLHDRVQEKHDSSGTTISSRPVVDDESADWIFMDAEESHHVQSNDWYVSNAS
jgi:tetratricopeptide (TPR) repeat protein